MTAVATAPAKAATAINAQAARLLTCSTIATPMLAPANFPAGGAGQGRAERSMAGQGRQGRAEQSRAGQDRAGRAGQGGTGQDRAGQGRAG